MGPALSPSSNAAAQAQSSLQHATVYVAVGSLQGRRHHCTCAPVLCIRVSNVPECTGRVCSAPLKAKWKYTAIDIFMGSVLGPKNSTCSSSSRKDWPR